MPPPELWLSLLWSLTGALLGRAFLPLSERLRSMGHRSSGAMPREVVVPVGQRIVARSAAVGHFETVTVLATAALFGLLAWRFGFEAELLAFSVLALFGVRLAVIDLAELRLPTSLVLPLYPVTMGLLGLAAAIEGTYLDLLRAAIGMIALPSAYLAVALASAGGIGSGDIRLAGPVGLVLAWESWSAVIIGTVLALIYANVTVLATIANGHTNRRVYLPFGPAMLGGMFSAILVPWTT